MRLRSSKIQMSLVSSAHKWKLSVLQCSHQSRGIPENGVRDVSGKYKCRIHSSWPNGRTPIKQAVEDRTYSKAQFPPCSPAHPQCIVPQWAGCHLWKGCCRGWRDCKTVLKPQSKAKKGKAFPTPIATLLSFKVQSHLSEHYFSQSHQPSSLAFLFFFPITQKKGFISMLSFFFWVKDYWL